MTFIQPISNELFHLATSVEEADGKSQIHLLLKLNEILTRNVNIQQTENLYGEIWTFDLPEKINEGLQQDFNLIRGSWKTACQLALIGVECCLGCSPRTIRENFLQEYTSTLMQLITKIVKEHGSIKEILQANLRNQLSSLITTISTLVKKFKYLSCNIVMSRHFMQFLMTEHGELSLLVLSFLKTLILVNKETFDHISDSRTHNISDELAYKLSSTANVTVAKVATEALLLLMDVHKPLVLLFSSKRYRGFKSYMMKWKGKGFDFLIDKLITILESQSEEYRQSKQLDDAATIIQSVFRGYRLRCRLLKASRAIANFQRIYRDKKRKSEDMKTKLIHDKLKREYTQQKRRNDFMNSKVKQLKVIEDIPAATIDKYFTDLQHTAARTIQAAWVGAHTRSNLARTKPQLIQNKAALTIQRQVRKWLTRCRQRKQAAMLDLLPDGLTDCRRLELQNVITNIRERYPKTCQSDVDLQEGHEKAFSLLSSHMTCLRQARRRDDHRKALLAQLSIQEQQMLSMPKLKDVTSAHVESFSSYSTPIVLAACQKHQDTVNSLRKPWWYNLSKNEIGTELPISDKLTHEINGYQF